MSHDRTSNHRIGYSFALFLGLAVAGMGYLSSFSNLAAYGRANGFPLNGTVLPIGLDFGIPALLILDWLQSSLFLRLSAWGLAASTVAANAAVAGGGTREKLIHATLPAIAILIIEAGRHLKVEPSRMDKIRLSRWLLSPARTVRIWRRMVLWEITSYKEALARESAIIHAQSVLMAHYQQRKWRQAADLTPLPLVHQISNGMFPSSVLFSADLQAAVREWVLRTVRDLTPRHEATKHVICKGATGLLFLRRPTPLRPSTDLAGPAGSRVLEIASLLSGPHAPVVYFVRNGNRIKIGTSQNLRPRIGTLCLRVADVALVLNGGQEHEAQLHKRFGDYRVGGTEWFKLTGELAAFVASGGDSPEDEDDDEAIIEPEESDDEGDRQPGAWADSSADASGEPAFGDERAPRPPRARRQPTARPRKRVTRRPLDRWVELTEPIYRDLLAQLCRQPTGEEFAAAIRKARLGAVSESTAKKIRAEIVDKGIADSREELSQHEADPMLEGDDDQAPAEPSPPTGPVPAALASLNGGPITTIPAP